MSNLDYETTQASALAQPSLGVPLKGGNESIHVRCPDCLKLYVVELASIQSQNPYFDCQVCETRFKLSGDLNPGETVATQKVSAEVTKDIKECPKCGQVNAVQATECSNCQVFFSKLRLSTTKTPNPSSLDIQWGLLINHFGDRSLHTRFMKLCAEMDQLPWALNKYRELNTLSGGDATCEGMIKKIEVLQADLKESRSERIKRVSWSRFGYWIFLALGFFCMVAGLFNSNLKNLTGLGIAIWALAYGVGVSLRGSLSLRDFFDPKT